jgi:hypothetical protein
MPIRGGKITKVEAERLEANDIKNLEFNFNIEELRQEKKILVLPYTTTINYNPLVARIIVKGEVFFEDEERKNKDTIAYFKENKRLPAEMADDVLTAINFSSTAVATLAAFAIGVNAPLNLPKARVAEPQAPSAG